MATDPWNSDEFSSTEAPASWVTVYDLTAGLCTVMATTPGPHHWTTCVKRGELGSGNGDFAVYDDEWGNPVMARIALDSDGPKVIHREFNDDLMGSRTLWLSREHSPYVWWPTGPFWRTSVPPTRFVARTRPA